MILDRAQVLQRLIDGGDLRRAPGMANGKDLVALGHFFLDKPIEASIGCAQFVKRHPWLLL